MDIGHIISIGILLLSSGRRQYFSNSNEILALSCMDMEMCKNWMVLTYRNDDRSSKKYNDEFHFDILDFGYFFEHEMFSTSVGSSTAFIQKPSPAKKLLSRAILSLHPKCANLALNTSIKRWNIRFAECSIKHDGWCVISWAMQINPWKQTDLANTRW